MRIISIQDENPKRRGTEYINLDRVEAVRKDKPLNENAKYRISIVTFTADKIREYEYNTEEKRDEVYENIVDAWVGKNGEKINIS